MRPLAPLPSREFRNTPMDELDSEDILVKEDYDPKVAVESRLSEQAEEDAENGYSSPVRSTYPRAKTHVIHRSQSFGDLNAADSPHSQYARKKLSSTSFKEDLLYVNGHLADKSSLRTSAGSSPLSPNALEPIQVTWGRRDSVQLVSLYSPPPKPDMYSQLLQTSAEKVLTKIKTRQQTLLSDVTPQHRASGDAKKALRLTPLVPHRRKLQPLKADNRSVSARNNNVHQNSHPNETADDAEESPT